MDIGRLRSLSPRHISDEVSDWILQDSPAPPILTGVLTSDSPSNNVDANRARTATEEASNDQSCEVRRCSRRNKPDEEQDVSAKVARHSAGVFRQWHEKQWEDCRAYVPRSSRPVQPWKIVLADTELSFHLDVTGTVGSSRQTGQDRAFGCVSEFCDMTSGAVLT
jgi:hypothetical protein